MENGKIYWFRCIDPNCDSNNMTWGSEQPIPDREWCYCNSPISPELIYEEEIQL